jgi:hypothetical protein
LVAETPARRTRLVLTVTSSICRRVRSASGSPASINAPSTMSPEIPEKQSK